MNDGKHPIDIVARVVASYVSNNRIMAQDLPGLIASVHESVQSLMDGKDRGGELPKPAVSIKKSVTPDYIVCLEDGMKFKSLRRHLRSSYDMTPEQYRAKWGLPHDYPMVAPKYAEHRSKLAKQIGLGRKRRRR